MGNKLDFPDGDKLAETLAAEIVAVLKSAIMNKGRASMALSGGSTPKRLFARLATIVDLDWAKVDITLVDERWVDEQSDRSNAALVKSNLMQGAAASARFIPLYSGGDLPDEAAVARTNSALMSMQLPFDVVTLGMGNDGHTASFFPGGDSLQDALTQTGPVLALNAEGAGEPRVTLTLPNIVSAARIFLHIEGAAKAETLQKANADGAVAQMPVRAILRHADANFDIYWCP